MLINSLLLITFDLVQNSARLGKCVNGYKQQTWLRASFIGNATALDMEGQKAKD